MSNWERIFTIVISSIVLVACNTASDKGINTPSSLPNVGTLTTTPEAVRAPSLTSTNTPVVRSSPTIPAQTLVAFATMNVLVANEPDLAKYYSWDCMIYPCYGTGLGLSPDGNWAVFFNGKEYGGLSIVKVDGTKRWDIDYFDIADCPCGPSAGVYVEHWSKDGKYFYVSPYDGSEGGFEDFWRSKTELWRLDLENGNIIDTKMGSAYAFSPNDEFIAYRFGQQIAIHEFTTGHENRITIPTQYKAFGSLIWSPDSRRIIFIGSINDLEQEEMPDGFTLFLLNLDNMTTKILLDRDQRYLYPLEWLNPNTVLLESMFKVTPDNLLKFSREKYQINLNTNEITKVE